MSMSGSIETIGDDEVLIRAALLVIVSGRASTSFLQIRLGIEHPHASLIMNRLEAAKVVSVPNHVGKRTVLIASPILGNPSSIHDYGGKPDTNSQSEYDEQEPGERDLLKLEMEAGEMFTE